MKLRRGRFALLGLLLLATIGCDQVAKQLGRSSLTPSEPVPAGPLMTLILTENTGAFLSIGSGLPASARFWILSVGVLIGLIALVAAAVVARRRGLPIVGAVLIAGGGFSNLVDRLANQGRVTDFVVLHVGPIHTGIFNLADVAITAGGVLLGFFLWRNRGRPVS